MSNYLEKLNKVLFNIKDSLSLNAIENFLKIEDIEDFFILIGYEWTKGCTFNSSTNKNVENVSDMHKLCDLLNKEINDDDECIYSDKNCLVFELFEQKEKFPSILEFYVTPYIFYHRSDNYTISLDGITTFHDIDYSKKWISFLLARYGKKYADAVRSQLIMAFTSINNKYEQDMQDLKSLYEILVKYEDLN